MRNRSLELKILPMILIGVAMSLPFQSALVFDLSLAEIGTVLQKLTLLNWAIVALSLMTAAAIWNASKATLVLAPSLIAIVVWNNVLVGFHAAHFTLTTTSMASFAFAFIFIPLLRKPVRLALLDSRSRWWKSSQRRKLSISAVLNPLKGHTVAASTFDLSETGAFIAIKDLEAIENLTEGQLLRLNLSLNSLRQIRCEAVVVRSCESPQGSYPTGCGIRFVQLDNSQRRRIREFLAEA